MIGIKCCQSCGLPWDKDPQKGGSNADGSRNEDYCSYCYQNGSFVQPGWIAADMQRYVVQVLTKRGFPEMMARMMVKGIPKLKRWQTSDSQ
ncbi:zinc ribbon domain-containing protein [Rurimicrobium arvi]|uniref:Zinc ribbon domain-containing protein n=1 Tax=Rurimicrobium arvi TaxID=2049916 RepID=A0ABP8MZ99_9BACT